MKWERFLIKISALFWNFRTLLLLRDECFTQKTVNKCTWKIVTYHIWNCFLAVRNLKIALQECIVFVALLWQLFEVKTKWFLNSIISGILTYVWLISHIPLHFMPTKFNSFNYNVYSNFQRWKQWLLSSSLTYNWTFSRSHLEYHMPIAHLRQARGSSNYLNFFFSRASLFWGSSEMNVYPICEMIFNIFGAGCWRSCHKNKPEDFFSWTNVFIILKEGCV